MRIAIVDDIAEERRLLHDKLEKALNRHCVHADIFEYESGEDYLSAARHQLFTVSFLDIYMNGITGIDAADELRTFDKTGLLIFTTASTDHALEGFRVRAMHYLVKPYNEKDIEALVSEILSRIPKPDKCLDIKVNGIGICLRFRDIAYAEHFCHMILIPQIKKSLPPVNPLGSLRHRLERMSDFFCAAVGASSIWNTLPILTNPLL